MNKLKTTTFSSVGAGLSRDRTVQPQNNRGINPLLQLMLCAKRSRPRLLLHLIAMLLCITSGAIYTAAADSRPIRQAQNRPNILLMMVDDLGYSDFGCYGSEILTPNIDRLASNGLRLTQFYNTAKCHSSRLALLSGQYSHYAGERDFRNAVNRLPRS